MIRKLIGISILWAILILIISGMPGDSIPQSPLWKIPHFDKLVHMGLYLPLGFFLMAEFKLGLKEQLQRYSIFLTLLIIALYGGLIEIGQGYLFQNRSADWYDFLADVFGGWLGVLLFQTIGYPLFKKFRKQ